MPPLQVRHPLRNIDLGMLHIDRHETIEVASRLCLVLEAELCVRFEGAIHRHHIRPLTAMLHLSKRIRLFHFRRSNRHYLLTVHNAVHLISEGSAHL